MGGPKKLAPYLVFANEKRDAAKELLLSEGAEKPSMGEIAKRVGVMWGQLDDAGKQVRPPAQRRARTQAGPGLPWLSCGAAACGGGRRLRGWGAGNRCGRQ